MKSSLKFFFILNICCIVLEVMQILLPAIMFENFNLYFPDVKVFLIVLLFFAIPVVNSVVNFVLIRNYKNGQSPITATKVIFWINSVFMLFVLAVVIYLTYNYWKIYIRYVDYSLYFPYKKLYLTMAIATLLYSITMAIVIVMQIIVFYKVRSRYKFEQSLVIDEIGT